MWGVRSKTYFKDILNLFYIYSLVCDMYERLGAEDGAFSPSYSQEHIAIGSQSEDSDTYSPIDTQQKLNSKSPNKLHQGNNFVFIDIMCTVHVV
jgi:hypothetical protein